MMVLSKSPGVCPRYEMELATAVSLLRIDGTNRQPGDTSTHTPAERGGQ
jgi:hypothetical protein